MTHKAPDLIVTRLVFTGPLDVLRSINEVLDFGGAGVYSGNGGTG